MGTTYFYERHNVPDYNILIGLLTFIKAVYRSAQRGVILALLLSCSLVAVAASSPILPEIEKKPDFIQVFRTFDLPMLLIAPGTGEIVDSNAAAASFYGYSPQQLRALYIQDINTFSAEQVADERRLAQEEGRNFFIFRHRLATGEIRTVEVYSRPYTFGQQTLLLSLIKDVTPGRQAEQELWHYQNRLEEMVDAQVDQIEHGRRIQVWILVGAMVAQALVIGFLILNIRRRRQLELERKHNMAAAELSSVRMNDAQRIAQIGSWELDHQNREWACSEEMNRVIGVETASATVSYREALSCIHPADRCRVAKTFRQSLRLRQPYDIYHRLRLPDGRIKHVHVLGENRYGGNGEPLVTIGTVQDITAKQLTDNALNALATEFATLSGKDFYRAVCCHLTEALGLESAFVGRMVDGGERIEVLSGWSEGGSLAPFGYCLPGTPCAEVVVHEQCIHPQGVQSMYPDDGMLVEMGIDAYIGSVLKDKSGQPMGVLVALGQKPLYQSELASRLLQLFVDRVSAEMQRSYAEQMTDQADRYRQIVLRFSSRIINLPLSEVDAAIEEAMQEIGLYIGADRCYLFKYDRPSGIAVATHHWCRPGLKLYTDPVPLDVFDPWVQQHMKGNSVIIDDVSQLPDNQLAAPLRELGVKSLLDIPMMIQGDCIGVIGVDSSENTGQFGPQTAEMLGLFADLVVNLKSRRESEAQLRLSASVFANANEGIMIMDVDGRIISVNQAFTHTTGYGAEEVLGRDAAFLGIDSDHNHQVQWQALQRDGYWSGEVWNRHKEGAFYAVLQKINAFYDESGTRQGYVCLLSDITTLKNQQHQLERIAHYDALTGLPNRTLLADRMQQAMAQARRQHTCIAILFIDLDGFKEINDNHSHAVGDRLLVEISRRMKQTLREEDTLARLGGDEFVAVLLNLEGQEASLMVIERLRRAAAEPLRLGGLELSVSASIGVVFYPQQDPLDADQLLRQADQAMYQAKQSGKNRYHLFDVERDRAVRHQHDHLERIREALQQNEFVLYYQPKVNLRTGQVIGCEALIRWQHPQEGLLPPAAFLPFIENHPLSAQVGDWVLSKAMDQIVSWRQEGLVLPTSVNIDAIHLQQADFTERLRDELARRPLIRPGDLELEILETTALDDVFKVSSIILDCQQLGVAFALDDFGTGYSSLTYLKQLPAQVLKIDRSFVLDMLEDDDDRAILDGVIRLAGAFKRGVIAEGVETQDHARALLKLGCDLGQGYAIAKPMPPAAMDEWMAYWRQAHAEIATERV